MKRSHLTWVAAIALLAVNSGAQASSVSGKIVGYECAHEGKLCPTDRVHPSVALEPDFVLVSEDGSYVFIPNVPRTTKLRYVLEDVTVSGEVNDELNLVKVEQLTVDGRTVWSPKNPQEAARALWAGESLN